MRAEALMAKMTARGLAITGGGFGGRVELGWPEVAAALGGLGAVPTALMRTIYLDDHKDDALIMSALCDFIEYTAAVEAVEIDRSAIEGLALLAMFEVVNPPRCGACNAMGEVKLPAGVIRRCVRCEGSGFVSRSLREQAAIAGIARESYRMRFQRLAALAYVRCSDWHVEGLRHLSRRTADAA